MRELLKLCIPCLVGSFVFVAAAGAQEPTTATQTTTAVTDDGMTKTTKTTTINGKVVRYEPGKTIVVVGTDNREMSYPLSATVIVPADVSVGRMVTLSTEPSSSGPVTVTRITTRSMTPEGNIKTETQTHSKTASGDETSMKITTITGTVSAFEPGRSVTFLLPDKSTVVYTVDSASVLPSDLAAGKTYTLQTTRTTTGGPLVVKKIVSTTKKTTSVQ